MNRNKTHSIILISFVCSCIFLQTCASNIVQSICRQTPFYSLCQSSLQSDPRSSTADVRTLAVIAAEKLKTKSTLTLNQIKKLQREATDPNVKTALSDCFHRYTTIVEADVPVIVDAVVKGAPKFGVDSASDAAVEADICEKSLGKTTPLSGSNRYVHDLSVVVESIVKLLL